MSTFSLQSPTHCFIEQCTSIKAALILQQLNVHMINCCSNDECYSATQTCSRMTFNRNCIHVNEMGMPGLLKAVLQCMRWFTADISRLAQHYTR
jgi:hypothetical protein